jgi:hypothetical protein
MKPQLENIEENRSIAKFGLVLFRKIMYTIMIPIKWVTAAKAKDNINP